MLEIEVELLHETKTIEWNKAHPTFNELKERLRQCGIAIGRNICVEVKRAGEFLTPDDDDLLDGPLILARVSQILCQTSWKRPKPSQPPRKDQPAISKNLPKAYHNRYEELFVEGVIPFVGKVFVLPKKLKNISVEDCTGTVGLVGSKGESIGAFHSVKKAWKHPRKYDVYIKYMNHDKQPCFPAKVVIYSDELDIFIAAPLFPFEFHFPKFLQPASGIAVGDTVHCLGFSKLLIQETLLQINKFGNFVAESAVKDVEFPAVFTGNVCFSGWKQVLADYKSFPNNTGAVIVDDNGHLKGIHVSSLSAEEYTPEIVEFEDGHSMGEKTKALFDQVNKCLPQLITGIKRSMEAAVFVPINVLMKTLNPAINPTTKAFLYS